MIANEAIDALAQATDVADAARATIEKMVASLSGPLFDLLSLTDWQREELNKTIGIYLMQNRAGG